MFKLFSFYFLVLNSVYAIDWYGGITNVNKLCTYVYLCNVEGGQSRTKNGGLFIGFATVQEQDNTTLQGTETLGENKCSLVWTAITEFSELGLMFNYFFDPDKYVDNNKYDNVQDGDAVRSQEYGTRGTYDSFIIKYLGNASFGLLNDSNDFLHNLQGRCHSNIGPYGRFKRPMIVEILQFALFRWKMPNPLKVSEVLLKMSAFGHKIIGPSRNSISVIPEFDVHGRRSLNGTRFCEEVLSGLGILKNGFKKYKNSSAVINIICKGIILSGGIAASFFSSEGSFSLNKDFFSRKNGLKLKHFTVPLNSVFFGYTLMGISEKHLPNGGVTDYDFVVKILKNKDKTVKDDNNPNAFVNIVSTFDIYYKRKYAKYTDECKLEEYFENNCNRGIKELGKDFKSKGCFCFP